MEKKNLKPVGNLARQVENAQKSLASWPEWMRKAARFEGSEPYINYERNRYGNC